MPLPFPPHSGNAWHPCCSWNWGSEQAGHLRSHSIASGKIRHGPPACPSRALPGPQGAPGHHGGWVGLAGWDSLESALMACRGTNWLAGMWQSLRLAHLPEGQDINALKAREGFVIDGQELRTGRGPSSHFSAASAHPLHPHYHWPGPSLTTRTAWGHPSHQRSPANHPPLKTTGGSNCLPNTQLS